MNAPTGFALTDLPPGVAVHRRATPDPYDVALLFVTAHAILGKRFTPVAERLTTAGGL